MGDMKKLTDGELRVIAIKAISVHVVALAVRLALAGLAISKAAVIIYALARSVMT